ncbi:glycosyl transferase family 4 [Candidatus Pacearchaeota archaeon]|nr:glycosyl transferase family 4 [Candidatus Pacearchaeota archaeon]
MNSPILTIPILLSFFVTMFLIPSWIKRAKKAKLTGRDMHKLDKRDVAESGGVTVVGGFALGALLYIALNTFFLKTENNFVEIFALLSSIFLIAFIAFTDDILGWRIGLRRRTRIVLVVLASIPLVAINAGKSSVYLPFFGAVDLGVAYPLIVIPLGIVGATTTFNFLAGYNGLEAGQGVIILSSLAILSFYTGSPWLSIIALCMIASLLAFLIYNFCPAKIFPGDTLTYTIGGLIAIISILGDFEKVAILFFIPYIAETFLKIRGKLVKQSFGKLENDSSLSMPYPKIYSLNHLAIYTMLKYKIKPTERKVVFAIWAFQIIIILAVFFIFRGGIF